MKRYIDPEVPSAKYLSLNWASPWKYWDLFIMAFFYDFPGIIEVFGLVLATPIILGRTCQGDTTKT
jgi:hypothetical protein